MCIINTQFSCPFESTAGPAETVLGAGRKSTRLFWVVVLPNPAPLRQRGPVLNERGSNLATLRKPGPAANLVLPSHVCPPLGAICSGC
ncbi:hypothetical protein DPMN_122042 [Dreissena polymorpha]|uniref:Uncharacterized protein n=1 Tax=Dreissena polymorpha TaxID=45954 RepID=A0A9D4JQ55_DREPO|nr:hypothetical protein DPMN_122042 [Dreissena polymorpha]